MGYVKFADTFLNQLVQKFVRPQRWTQTELDLRMLLHQLVAGLCQIPPDVHTCREKIGHHQHTRSPFGNACGATGYDIWLSQFQIARFDDRILVELQKPLRQIDQFLIGFSPATVFPEAT